jgi:hypothetical protein
MGLDELTGVVMNGTASGRTEIHTLSRVSGFQQFVQHIATPLGITSAAQFAFTLGDYDGDSVADLVVVKMNGTASNSTEVHILGGASGFQQWLLNTATPLGVTDPSQAKFALADHDRDGVPDLFVILMNRTGTRTTEVHVLSGASKFQRWIVQSGTPLGTIDASRGTFELGDYNRDGVPDLAVILMNQTGTGRTEVHILSGASAFQQWLLHTGTPLEMTTATRWQFKMADANGDGTSDLYAVKMSATGTGSTEVHVLSGASGFQSWLVQTGTPLAPTTPSVWSFR